MLNGETEHVLGAMIDHIWVQMVNVWRFLNYAKPTINLMADVRAVIQDTV